MNDPKYAVSLGLELGRMGHEPKLDVFVQTSKLPI